MAKKVAWIIMVIIVLVVVVGGVYLLRPSENMDEEDRTAKIESINSNVLLSVDNEAICYDILEDIALTLYDSCSDENLIKAVGIWDEGEDSYSTVEEKERCAITLANYMPLMEEFCGEGSVMKAMELYADKAKAGQGSYNQDCFDKAAMGLPCD